MPPTRTSSVSVARRRSARLPRTQSQPGISSFARATKPGVPLASVKEKVGKDVSVESQGLPVSPSKKRKLHELENVETTVREQKPDPTLTPSKSLKFSSLSVSSPRSGHYAAAQSTTAPSGLSVSHETRAPRDRICEEDEDDEIVPATPTRRATVCAKPKTTKATSLPRSKPVANLSAAAARPACVDELVRLHSAFLKALTIHAAHRGVAAPADLREFLPSIERIWKKRKVVVKDVQRLLWIWKRGAAEGTEAVFRLANHGLGRVCLEKVNGRTERINDEAELQKKFEDAVDMLWRKFSDEGAEVDFIGTIGLQAIEESLAPFSAFRKGQQRLQDLKGGVIKVKMGALLAEASEEENLKTLPAKVREATTNRRQGLLDRIKNKALRQSKLPPPPSKEVLLRRAAAGRVEEVAGVLALLRPAGYVGNGPLARMAAQRTPFCLETIVRNVQDSTRNPISEKEVETCLEILSRGDVAGHWVNIVVANQLKSVVLKSCGDVQLKDLGTKIARLKPGWEESPNA